MEKTPKLTLAATLVAGAVISPELTHAQEDYSRMVLGISEEKKLPDLGNFEANNAYKGSSGVKVGIGKDGLLTVHGQLSNDDSGVRASGSFGKEYEGIGINGAMEASSGKYVYGGVGVQRTNEVKFGVNSQDAVEHTQFRMNAGFLSELTPNTDLNLEINCAGTGETYSGSFNGHYSDRVNATTECSKTIGVDHRTELGEGELTIGLLGGQIDRSERFNPVSYTNRDGEKFNSKYFSKLYHGGEGGNEDSNIWRISGNYEKNGFNLGGSYTEKGDYGKLNLSLSEQINNNIEAGVHYVHDEKRGVKNALMLTFSYQLGNQVSETRGKIDRLLEEGDMSGKSGLMPTSGIGIVDREREAAMEYVYNNIAIVDQNGTKLGNWIPGFDGEIRENDYEITLEEGDNPILRLEDLSNDPGTPNTFLGTGFFDGIPFTALSIEDMDTPLEELDLRKMINSGLGKIEKYGHKLKIEDQKEGKEERSYIVYANIYANIDGEFKPVLISIRVKDKNSSY